MLIGRSMRAGEEMICMSRGIDTPGLLHERLMHDGVPNNMGHRDIHSTIFIINFDLKVEHFFMRVHCRVGVYYRSWVVPH